MDSESRNRVEPLFHAASQRQPGPEREAFLDGACGEDTELRGRVEALLVAHDEATGFLEEPAVESSREGPGTSIGPYKLLQEIGEGGMGVVYMAEQLQPVARKVALKVIKLGMDTKQVIARFEAERQALAMMDHPNIARVLDAGATETGRPYFVMELVRGISISEYCDKHKLSTEERLGLFVDVCRAVQHAHQKGVIHRDLKPTNVLVTSHDGTPVPKIIDFGVAKATNQKLTERTLFTEFQQIIGTPEYMSPEQAEMSGLDVDTRSDIYALGVLLYQLLTGTTPVDPTDLRTAGFEEMTRMIREDEPPSPSNRVSKLGADAEKIASRRSSDAGSLSRLFRGDLDWIVMKALEKDRTRRYETASAFAADVQRHLENRPVEAGPPGSWYRLTKFAHRHRKSVAAAAVLFLVVALGLAGTVTGFLRAREEAEHSRAVSDSLEEVLAMSDSTRAFEQGEVERVLETVRDVFGEEHATYAAVLNTLALRMYDAGDFETAEELAREAIDMWERVHGEDHPNVAIAMSRLGAFLRTQGKDEEAEAALRESLALLEGTIDVPGLAGYDARLELADLLSNLGEYDEAEQLLGEALDDLRASPSPSRYRVLDVLERRFLVHLNMASPRTADTLREIYDESHLFYPEDSPMLAVSALGLGNYLSQQGRLEEAEPYLREAIERFGSSGKKGGYYLLAAHDSLFQILRGRSDLESIREADEILRNTIEMARPLWGVDMLVTNLRYYARRMVERDRREEALDTMLEAHQILVDADRPPREREDVRDQLTLLALGVAAHADGTPEQYASAREAIEVALMDEPEHAAMIVTLGAVLYRQGAYEEAAETLDLPPMPLLDYPGGLARRIAPADHVFRAMAYARIGDQVGALAELAAFERGLSRVGGGEEGPLLLKEAKALIHDTPSGSADG